MYFPKSCVTPKVCGRGGGCQARRVINEREKSAPSARRGVPTPSIISHKTTNEDEAEWTHRAISSTSRECETRVTIRLYHAVASGALTA